MSDPAPMENRGSALKRLFLLVAFLLVVGMGFTVYLSFQPQDLDGISGYRSDDRLENPIDIPARIEAAAKSRQPITLSERQINSWLAANLKVKQEGKLADVVDMKGVWIRFDKVEGGRAEIVIEREVRGIIHTSSLYMRFERKKKENGAFTTTVRKDGGRFLGAVLIGGRFGQLKVPQGFILFTQDAYKSLGALFEREAGFLEEEIIRKAGGEIIFEDKKMRIDFPKD
ncbi:hypothetical protein N9165_02000 [Akkermansiaceae bacterium]|nr:hypothetical protein [Akkermansiaceae bacterium]